jgi:hypothetical protein
VRATAGGVREGVVSAGRGEAVQYGAGPSAHADWFDMRISSREIYHKHKAIKGSRQTAPCFFSRGYAPGGARRSRNFLTI